MTDVAVPQAGTAPAAAGGQDETYTDMIMHELAMLQVCLQRTAVKVAALDEVAGDLDGQVTFVDEEAERVEAPLATRAAMDACSTVANTIARHAKLLGQQTETTYHLTGLGREGMHPAVVTQDENRAVGAGPKIHATANAH